MKDEVDKAHTDKVTSPAIRQRLSWSNRSHLREDSGGFGTQQKIDSVLVSETPSLQGHRCSPLRSFSTSQAIQAGPCAAISKRNTRPAANLYAGTTSPAAPMIPSKRQRLPSYMRTRWNAPASEQCQGQPSQGGEWMVISRRRHVGAGVPKSSSDGGCESYTASSLEYSRATTQPEHMRSGGGEPPFVVQPDFALLAQDSMLSSSSSRPLAMIEIDSPASKAAIEQNDCRGRASISREAYQSRRTYHQKSLKQLLASFLLPVACAFLISSVPVFAQTQEPVGIVTAAPVTPIATRVPTGAPSPDFDPPALAPPSFITPRLPTVNPTQVPTGLPTIRPTSGPTVSSQPTAAPSAPPTDFPTRAPSFEPTGRPTFSETSVSSLQFRQTFIVENARVFSVGEVAAFQDLYESYTVGIIDELPNVIGGSSAPSLITSECDITGQGLFELPDERRLSARGVLARLTDTLAGRRTLQAVASTSELEIDYTMTYESQVINVTELPQLFESFINNNLGIVVAQMRLFDLNVTEARRARANRIVATPDPSPAPTQQPSHVPTVQPTITRYPSIPPTKEPTNETTFSPTPAEPLTEAPAPAGVIPPFEPTPDEVPPSVDGGDDGVAENTLIVVGVVTGGSIILICLFIYYRRRRYAREQEYQRDAVHGNVGLGHDDYNGSFPRQDEAYPAVTSNYYNKYPTPEGHSSSSYDAGLHYSMPNDRTIPSAATPGALVSPSESLVSGQSMISAGNSVAEDSGDEADATFNLRDEFDQYKDQNLEKMRADVEDNLTGFDGMMSQALTKALIDDDEAHFDSAELSWGGTGPLSGAEVEASALGEVVDWLRRNEEASIEEKRAFMQQTLYKMVASVRHGVLGPDDAARSIHECAALLGMQLATEIPVTTVMISGMRTNVVADDVVASFDEFGEISEAAVAPNQLGFGILRFKSKDSVNRVMQKFRNENIFVQDVAVQLKILQPGYNDGTDSVQPSSNRSNRS